MRELRVRTWLMGRELTQYSEMAQRGDLMVE